MRFRDKIMAKLGVKTNYDGGEHTPVYGVTRRPSEAGDVLVYNAGLGEIPRDENPVEHTDRWVTEKTFKRHQE